MSQNRVLNVFPEFLRSRFCFTWFGYHKRHSHSCMCHAFNNMAVNRRTDSKSKETGLVHIVSYQVESLLFDINISIGGNYKASGKTFGTCQTECPFECRQQFGSATTLLTINKINRFFNVFLIGTYRSFAEQI